MGNAVMNHRTIVIWCGIGILACQCAMLVFLLGRTERFFNDAFELIERRAARLALVRREAAERL